MKKWLNKKNLLLFCVILLGVFLRIYHFKDWLIFQSDQSRDAMVVSRGLRNLPLLGPQASSSSLKLGPIFYYFQYATSWLKGFGPARFALPDLFFSILSIPLAFILFRKYFSSLIAFCLMLLWSVSIFLIIYGRFAWNPNSIPFFSLLMFWGLLSFVEKKEKTWRYIFLAISFLSAGILMQLHFITFFVAPATLFLFFCLNSKKLIDLKGFLIATFSFFLVLSPLIYYDVTNQWSNSKSLVETFQARVDAGQQERSSFLKNGFKTIQDVARYSWLAVSGDQMTQRVRIKEAQDGSLKLYCRDDCRRFIYHSMVGWLFFATGIILTIWEFRKKNLNKEKLTFLRLTSIWLALATFCLFFVIKESAPRFFLVLAVPSFFFLGLIFEKISIWTKKNWLIFGLVFLLAAQNLKEAHLYFVEARSVTNLELPQERQDIISPTGKRTTLSQLEKIAKVIDTDSLKHQTDFVVVMENRYARSVYYLLKEEFSSRVQCYLKMSDFEVGPPVVYFIIDSASSEHISSEVEKYYAISSSVDFGNMTLYRLLKKNNSTQIGSWMNCRVF